MYKFLTPITRRSANALLTRNQQRMDFIDLIEIPSFENKRRRARRNASVAVGLLAAAILIEKYNGGISRTAKSIRKRVTSCMHAHAAGMQHVARPPALSRLLMLLSVQGPHCRNCSMVGGQRRDCAVLS